MAWPNPFWRLFADENTRDAWGYRFQWTPLHLNESDFHHMKYTYDTLAEECLEKLDEISPPPDSQLPRNNPRLPVKEGKDGKVEKRRDLYELLRDHHEEDEKLNELWTQVNTIPDWVDWEQIERGQDVFYRYGGPILTALAYNSLLGGMGSPRVVEVLSRTGGFGVKVAKHRMYETTQHVLQCTKSLESIKPGGDGFASTIRVRLLHCAVRRRIMKLTKERPGYYDVEVNGVPINDLDQISTISVFSSTLIWLGLPRQGIWLRKQEILDYIALWRLVAYYIGAPTDVFETPEKAKAMMESLSLTEFNPSETSHMLADNIITSLSDVPPAYASREFLSAGARWLNAWQLSDALNLMKPPIYYYALVIGQCFFFMGLCYTYRAIPSWDKRKIKALKQLFYSMIVENKSHGLGEETVFEFKYVPDLAFRTEKVPDDKLKSGLTGTGVERRNLQALMVAGVLTTAVALAGWTITRLGYLGVRRIYQFVTI